MRGTIKHCGPWGHVETEWDTADPATVEAVQTYLKENARVGKVFDAGTREEVTYACFDPQRHVDLVHVPPFQAG